METEDQGEKPAPAAEAWHLDKKVPIGLLIGLLIQVLWFSWWASSLNSSLQAVIEKSQYHDVQISALNTGREQNSSRITALETRGQTTDAKLDRIEDKLDRLIEKQPTSK
jgi:glutathione S-transferase